VPSGCYLGPRALGEALAIQLAGLVEPLQLVGHDEPAPSVAAVVIDATALDTATGATGPARAALGAAVRQADLARRVIHLVPLAWSGRTPDPSAAGRAASTVAEARATALSLAATTTTVNVVVVPDDFPAASASPSAPVPHPPTVAGLAHVIAYFADPANGYVVGQVLSLCGGDDAWGNLGF
jgi:hypothetical protein